MSTDCKFKNPSKVSRIKEFVAYLLSTSRISRTRAAYFLSTAGSIINFDQYCRVELKSESKVKSREEIFNQIISEILEDADILEFGVAHGYTTNYFLSRVTKNINYFGFDLFTGLPNRWRNLEAGHFSNEGVLPEIADSRLTWVVGDINKTFGTDFQLSLDRQLVVIFDLDLLKPTLHVFNLLQSKHLLQKGTIIYFDEAFDENEFFVIKNMFIENFKYRVMARTWSSIAFQIL